MVEQAKKFDFGRWLNSPPRRPEQAAALREQVARALARQYPGAELARLAVKWSASSFKRLAPLPAEEPAAGPGPEADRQEIAEEFREDLLAEAAKGAAGALGDNINDNIDDKLDEKLKDKL